MTNNQQQDNIMRRKEHKKMKITKTEKLIAALESGKEKTSEQLAKRSGLINVSSTVHRLRNEGLPIYTNTKGSKGNKYQVYRLA